MKKTRILTFLLIPLTYAMLLWCSNYTLTGFWTDFIFIILSIGIVVSAGLRIIGVASFKKNLSLVGGILILGLIILSLRDPFSIDMLSTRSFQFQKVDGRIFHAYFKPVGAYSGGQGNFLITESPKYFPLIEKPVFYDKTVHHDFSKDSFEDEPIDNYEVVKSYIRQEIIEK